ncbi:adenosylmethionine--8-amino-7-oxononanoate transaminase [Pontibacter sp. MBLB2868]|uniref:adenosylmethionine--8-amino-7-oxononanoate transaminase n=1 Tax=Pontibacter sp. MBLB2868 TaxID=3451555 RepID=UPI003F74BE1F
MKLWYPYSQMARQQHRYPVTKANGVNLYLEDGKKVIDGVSSWWATIHGYNHPALNETLVKQADQFSHVMLGGLDHQPAHQLAEKLVQITPEGLNHVFFSDSGSVGVEVALKMAIQYWVNHGNTQKSKFLSLRNAYHGDTFKAMEVGDDSDFQIPFGHVLHKGFFMKTPSGGFAATLDDVKQDLIRLEQLLQENHEELAAFIVEPLVQCAGGFKMYSPAYLTGARALCDKYSVLLIYDEVATGFGRTGKLFAADHAQAIPDIIVLGKALTAGYLGHAATLTTTKIFNSFLGTGYNKAFMHGPTFMGNPLACAVALKSIEIIEQENYLDKIANIEAALKQQLPEIKHDGIQDIRVLGAIGVIEVSDSKLLEGFTEFAVQQGVWLRPFGKYLYTMPPYIISQQELERIIQVMDSWFRQV